MIRLSVGEYKNQDEAGKALVKLRGSRVDGVVLRGEDQKYRILVGSYADQANANNEQVQLAAKGVKASLKKQLVSVPTQLLTAGSFPTSEAALYEMQKLEKRGMKPVVIEVN